MNICKGTKFTLRDKRVIATNDFKIREDEHGYFILNFWEQCDCEDIDVLPVTFIRCENERELYVLKKDNIVLGSKDEACLT